ncbi:polymeric immunoglobulin receptor-like isoform X2 [Astatotilapia calliptera]|uniref:polymeric immunoglobulin receptor-like isoform X2 n=1 Tax=Astatotilapia calliptera TaxID=8154 RepID=UPI000E401578|nr:polymeric immunoglobulin receptor-like isoform X2 [Astatotilapia calliptera]
MKVRHTLICFFFLSLQDGNPEVTDAQILHYGVIGGDFKAGFSFESPGTWKMFCREECEGENILINTTDVRAQTGRYSIEYEIESVYVLYVSISKLTESDSGQYSCGLGGSSSSASYERFVIVVAEALLDGNDDQLKHFDKETGSSLTVGCSFEHSGDRGFFCRGKCGRGDGLVHTNDVKAQSDRYNIGYDSGVLYVSITQLTKSDSGRYRCLLRGSSSSSSRDFAVTVTDAGPSATTTGSCTPSLTLTGSTEQPERAASAGVLLYVIISLLIIIILSSLTVLIICIKRKSSRGLRTRGNSEGTNMEDVHYENCTPGSTREDSIYQSLDPAGRDQDQTYSTLTHHT